VLNWLLPLCRFGPIPWPTSREIVPTRGNQGFVHWLE
jgi:hypothetical protein